MAVQVGPQQTWVVLVKGLPRPAAATVHIAGMRTNFAMPDLHSIGALFLSQVRGSVCLQKYRDVYTQSMSAQFEHDSSHPDSPHT